MRKVFVSAVLALLCLAGSACANVEADPEIHRVIGGLYSLACAAELNGNSEPQVRQLRQYFSDVPNDWYSTVQVSRVNNAVWAGVAVGKMSTARQFLRTHAQELGICDSPEGYAWLGGEYAWLKVSGISGLRAARGKGTDSGAVFLNVEGSDSWWMGVPSFTPQTAKSVIARHGMKNPPELHKPSGIHTSIYESVKPSDVRKPADMHVGRKRSSFDKEIEIGRDVDLIFNPLLKQQQNNY
ncbi:MAG: hypothetical protein IJU26_06780 [Synergistaceae bacterium]|nr:hypothetical protein [Synergistaceae bacterium]